MDSEDLSPALLKAGQEYLDALRRLKLHPEGLLWARVDDIRGGVNLGAGVPGDWLLVLITSAIDEGGPSALNELLFKAYDASATPKEISPFIVEVMSSKAPFVGAILDGLNNPPLSPLVKYTATDGQEGFEEVEMLSNLTMIGGLWFERKWIYYLSGLRDQYADRRKHWREFKRTVNSLAA